MSDEGSIVGRDQKRLHRAKGEWVESSERIEAFLDDIQEVFEEHGLALGHEDWHGAFLIFEFDEEFVDWVRGAHIAFDTDDDEAQCG